MSWCAYDMNHMYELGIKNRWESDLRSCESPEKNRQFQWDLNRYHGGHGFKSCWSLRFFCWAFFATAKITFTSITCNTINFLLPFIEDPYENHFGDIRLSSLNIVFIIIYNIYIESVYLFNYICNLSVFHPSHGQKTFCSQPNLPLLWWLGIFLVFILSNLI